MTILTESSTTCVLSTLLLGKHCTVHGRCVHIRTCITVYKVVLEDLSF